MDRRFDELLESRGDLRISTGGVCMDEKFRLMFLVDVTVGLKVAF